MSDKPWREKASREIASLSYAAWDKANPKNSRGQRPKKHKPYSIPAYAADLVTCLNTDDEERAKAMFMRANVSPEFRND